VIVTQNRGLQSADLGLSMLWFVSDVFLVTFF